MEKYAITLMRYRWTVILLSLLAIFATSYGLKNLKVETDYEVFFNGKNERLQAHKEMERLYGRQDFVRITVHPHQGDVFQPRVLKLIEDITAKSWQLAYTRRVDSLTNHQYIVGDNDELIVENLFDTSKSMDNAEFERRKHYAITQNFVVDNFVNRDGTIAGSLSTLTLPPGDPQASLKASQEAEKLVAEYRQVYPDIDFYLTGSVVINKNFFEESTVGTAKLMVTMLALMLTLVAFLLRSFYAIVCVMLILLGATFSSLGIASWVNIPFTAPSSMAPLIIATIVVANTVHIMSGLLDELRRGVEKDSAIIQTLVINIEPVFLTTLTTVIGFLCLNTSDVPPYQYLGTTTAIGGISAFILTYTLLPALLASFPFKAATTPDHEIGKFWSDFGGSVVKWRHPITIIMLTFAVGTSMFVTRNVINDSLVTYFDKDVPFRIETEYVMDNLTFFYNVTLSLPAKSDGKISDPEYMRHVEDLAEWARQQPEVRTVLTYTSFMKQINKALHNNSEEWYRLPEDKELASQYLLLYEMSLPYGLDLENQLTLDKTASRMVIGFYNVTSNQMRDFDERTKAWTAQHFPDYMQSAVPSGPPLLFAYIWHDSAKSNLWGMLTGALLISLVILIAMKSVTLGVLSLIPNILPAIMAFGVWGLINGQIDIGTSIVATIALGIVVDDTVHFISKYRYACLTLGYDPKTAVQYAFATVGKALFITTVVLVVGFAVLIQSNFTINSAMGLLTAILLTIALFFDLFLLPALLMLMTPLKKTAAVKVTEELILTPQP